MTTAGLDSSAVVIRALVNQDMDTFRRLRESLDADERCTLAVVLTAAFNKAAVGKFGEQHSAADIIEFVAEARALHVGPEAVGAEYAERVLQAALGEDHLVDDMDG
jgi:hypothetical protein